ncbi:hypothetical protein [Burkholderia cepacia]|uniref:hypothetical protein n=1 Tax=Burkholderia cepacia TaxID=292 RepID=UPI003EE2192B
MGILLRDEQASYRANAKGMIFPISDLGLEVVGVFGGDVAASSRNFATGKPAFTVIGSPIVNANSVVLRGAGAYMQTEMADAHDLTLIAISRPLDMTGHLMLSNYQSASQAHAGPTAGVSLYTSPDPGAPDDGLHTVIFQRALTDGTNSIIAGSNIDNDQGVGVYQFICGRFDSSTGIRRLDNVTTGHSLTSGQESRTRDLGERLRIGCGYDMGAFDGSAELVAVVGMSRSITDQEMATLYAFWKGYCSRRGITI